MTANNADWREFEKMVARIEESLSPKGAVVKSPDRIRDLVSGRLREVDASISFQVGSTPILITIECRKRKSVQDDTWIEQLATKRGKIGAAKTIAVSSTGFSDSAERTATLYGIELRSLTDRIEEEIVQQFLSGIKLSFIVTEYRAHSIAFQLADNTPLREEDFSDDLSAAIRNGDGHGVIAKEAATDRVLTMDSILGRVLDTDLPEDGTPVQKRVVAEFPPNEVTVSTKQGDKFLSRVQIVADFIKKMVPAPADSLYEYATLDQPLRHTIEATGQISDTEAVVLQVDISSPALENRTAKSSKRSK